MNRNNLTTAVIAGIAGFAGLANMASAVNLNPDGLGQVLLYPYYTVNNGQATLLSVVNTTDVGKAVKVRFLEGYNSREVLDFNLFLSPFDVWTAEVFALQDGILTTGGGVASEAAGIFSGDKSCTYPAFSTPGLSNGETFQSFLDYAFIGTNSDTGPTTDDRTREGHFEMISMGDIVPGSALADDITHVDGVPPDCGDSESDFEAGAFASIVAPTSGLFGAASIINADQGDFYSYNADALDGFTAVPLPTTNGSLTPSLQDVNDLSGTTATSYVFNDGALLTSVYPAATQAIDAVSSVFEAANVYNQYESTSNASIRTDWVVTFPTKRFYVDAQPGGAIVGATAVIPPFEELFGATADGLSCTIVGLTIFDREEDTTTPTGCGFSPCPPGQPPSSICHETNVVTFLNPGEIIDVLNSNLTENIVPLNDNGWVDVTLTGNGHDMRPSTNLNVFHGLPVTGFEAVQFINGNLNNSGSIQNYSGVYRHRISRSCDNGGGACS